MAQVTSDTPLGQVEGRPAQSQADAAELSLPVIVMLLSQRMKLLLGVTIAGGLLAGAYAHFSPTTYRAEATILPPQQQQSSLAALASGALGGLASSGMAASLGIKNVGDLYIGLLGSRTIADHIVQQFNLKKIYGRKLASEARASLIQHVSFSTGKDSLIKIAVSDRDSKRAAAMANAYVAELYKQNSRLALTESAERRLFFEQQLSKEKDALANAEVALRNTQKSTGLFAPTGQEEVMIRSGAQLRAEIASREVQLQAMRSFATDQNPQVQLLQKEIGALRGQLAGMDAGGASSSGSDMPIKKLPEANLDYLRKLRDMKYHETLFELLAKQYEAARLDEAKDAPVIQVVDYAVAPDLPNSHKTVPFTVAGATGFGTLACFILIGRMRLRTAMTSRVA